MKISTFKFNEFVNLHRSQIDDLYITDEEIKKIIKQIETIKHNTQLS
jgi:hypothetical protein